MDSSFTKVPLNVPKLSGFDKSHQNLLTSQVGTITPILIDELIPGSKIDLKLALNAQLPPLASDTFMRCSIKTEAFFVPFRLLAGSFESWFTDTPQRYIGADGTYTFTDVLGWLPCLGNWENQNEQATIESALFNPGTLGDYLGLRFNQNAQAPNITPISALPFLAYWRVIDDWYRNTLVERPVFVRPQTFAPTTSGGSSTDGSSAPSSSTQRAGTAPYYFFSEKVRTSSGSNGNRQNYCFSSLIQLSLANGKFLYELAQRNFDLDYFTTAMPDKQLGQQQSVTFSTSGSTGSFTIEALRMSNSLQQFAERNQLSGVRYQDTLYQRYGANLPSGVAQRALFLGSDEYVIYSKGIYQTSNNLDQGSSDADTAGNANGAFGSVGTKYGSASATGNGLHIRFEANEPGYIMVMATLVPHVTYSSGIDRRFLKYNRAGSITDMANPILQSVGPQPILDAELTGDLNSNNIFGYTDRYAEFKTMNDELHGILRDGSTLQAYALQRSFASGSAPQINSAFLKIPTNYLDQVFAVSKPFSGYGYWMDTYFDYKVAMPLSKYSLPTLQDPAYEHGKTIVVNKGGSKL